MNNFSLRIVTPDGVRYDGKATSLLVRTVDGDIQILANHADLLVAVGTGKATLIAEEDKRNASCSGGFLSVTSGEVTLAVTTWEFADEIDLARAKAAKERAEAALAQSAAGRKDMDLDVIKAKLSRALTRISVAEKS